LNFIIFGANSRLANAIAEKTNGFNCLLIPKDIYKDIQNLNLRKHVLNFLEISPGQTYVLNCVSITDSSINFSEAYSWNFRFALDLFAFTRQFHLKYLTFGTMSEDFLDNSHPSNYLRTKLALTKHISAQGNEDWLHFRLHTLYGFGVPAAHSFLGQLLAALNSRKDFEISNGNQIREYHHYSDDVNAVMSGINAGVSGILDINSGNPIRLKSIAETVFSHFSPSLKVQVVHRNEERFENYFKYYGKNYLTHKLTFRDPFDGIIEYLEELRCP
jgi:hypothetical protein